MANMMKAQSRMSAIISLIVTSRLSSLLSFSAFRSFSEFESPQPMFSHPIVSSSYEVIVKNYYTIDTIKTFYLYFWKGLEHESKNTVCGTDPSEYVEARRELVGI